MDISVCITNLLLRIYGLDKFVDIQHAKISRYCSYDLAADSSSQSNHHHIISLPEYIILEVGINYASKTRRNFFPVIKLQIIEKYSKCWIRLLCNIS